MRHYRKGVLLGMSLAEVFILLLFLFSFVVLSDQAPRGSQTGEETGSETSVQVQDTTTPEDKTDGSVPAQTPGEPEVPSSDEPDGVFPPADSTQTSSDPSIADGLVVDQPEESIFPAPYEPVPEAQPSPTPPQNESEDAHTWPPIISLDEAEGYFFPKGRASLSEEFDAKLRGPIKEELAGYIEEYKTDVIEVVGHTDEQPLRGSSNLDNRLLEVLGGRSSADSLSPADNVGLGMARAAAVATVLVEALAPVAEVKVIAYSAGQTIEPGDILSRGLDKGDNEDRRRIEIRLRRSDQRQ